MIHVNFGIQNPWSNRWDLIYHKFGPAFFEYKFWEFQVDRSNDIVGFSLDIRAGKSDHKGFDITLALVGFRSQLSFYDSRHYQDVQPLV